MRKLLFIFTALIFLLTPALSFAQVSIDKKDIVLPEKETLNQDYFAVGNSVNLGGTVNGDVYAAAGNVSISGKVNGDLLVTGGQVSISGEVTQDVRVAAGQVTISGKIGKSITVFSGSVQLTSSAQVGGSIVGVGGTFNLASPISGNIRIAAGDVLISGRVGGDVNIASTTLSLTSKALLAANLNYWSNNSATIDPSAKISGNITKSAIPDQSMINNPSFEQFFAKVAFYSRLASFITLLILGLVLTQFFPKFNDSVTSSLSERPLAAVLIGLITLIVVPIISALLFATILGIPLAIILLSFYVVAIYLTRIFAVFWIGKFVLLKLNQRTLPSWTLVVGLIIYTLLTLIPFLGGLISFVIATFSLGAYLLASYNFYLGLRKKSLI